MKHFSLATALLMVFALAACDQADDASEPSDVMTDEAPMEEPPMDEPPMEEAPEDEEPLIDEDGAPMEEAPGDEEPLMDEDPTEEPN